MIIPNLNFGGAQRVFYNLSVELAKHYRVVECVFNFDSGHAFESGNQVISLEVKGGNNLVSKVWQFLIRYKRLRDLKRRINPDICISHLEGADLINVLSQQNDKTITWVHGSKRHDQNITGFLGMLRHYVLIPYTYKRADWVVTVSKAIKDELTLHYRVDSKKIRPIYNYFDVEIIKSKSQSPIDKGIESVFDDIPVLIFSGRLVKQKNPESMLRWFATFIERQPCRLVLVGDGELRNELLSVCLELKLRTYHPWSNKASTQDCQVIFLGFQENPFQFIKMASVFILPSLWEGFPMALGEAMCCGIPVVSANCPTGPLEMLTEKDSNEITYPYFAEYGVLMPLMKEENFDVWSQGLITLLNDKNMLANYSSQSSKRSEVFSKENNTRHLVELIENILS
jgi:glycosyltransferase involved in cell wall biosynthesis